MSSRISYNVTSQWGQMTARVSARLVAGMQDAQRERAALYNMSYPDDWAALEAELGLEAGKGQEFFTVIDGLVQLADDPRFQALAKVDQGGSS